MKQPHTEAAIDHTDDEQDTGNHRATDAKPKTPGGTRIGAENVEPASGTGPQADLDETLSVNDPAKGERS